MILFAAVLLAFTAYQPLLTSSQSTELEAQRILFSYGLTSAELDPVYGVRLDSTVPAVDLALEYINNNSTLLPDITLSYRQVTQLQCTSVSRAANYEADFGILGLSCDELLDSDSSLAPIQVLFTPSTENEELLYDENSVKLYKTHPSSNTYAEALVAFVRYANWQRLSVVTLANSNIFFNEVLQELSTATNSSDITLISAQLNGTGTITFPSDVRIFFLNMDRTNTIQTLCQAYLAGMVFPHYVWITYSRNYTEVLSDTECDCNAQQFSEFMDGVFTLTSTAVELGNSSLTVVKEKLFTPLNLFTFDAVWILANTLDRLLDSVNGLQDVENGSLVLNKDIAVNGMTGDISFDAYGNRVNNVLGLSQYGRAQNIEENLVARIYVSLLSVPEFIFVVGENESTIFRGPVPPDGTPIKELHNLPIPLIVVYYILASAGIAFSVVCLLFTVIFRERKIVKLTTPNLNYFMIAGAIIIYSSVYFRLLPSISMNYAQFLCVYQGFSTVLGYVLFFAPIVMKMFRIFYIFHKPHPGKKVLKDWHLSIVVLILVGINLAILIIGAAVKTLRPFPATVPDMERPTGTTSTGITINFCTYECYNERFPALIWTGLSFIILVLIQVAAFVLALVTRKVAVRALNDSIEVSIIIYTTSVVLLCLGAVTFGLNSYLIVTETLYTGGIMLAATVGIFFLFVPKMVSLYRDPEGENVFKSTAVEDNALSNTASHSIGHSMNLHVNETANSSTSLYHTNH